MIETLEDAIAKCKQDKTIVIGKVRFETGGARVLMVLPVTKTEGLSENIGTVEVAMTEEDAKMLSEKLSLVANADTTGWAVEEKGEG